MSEKPKKTYKEKLLSPKWQRRRLDVMSRDGFACQKCRNTEATLNVHHLYYTNGKDPWDYPDDALITLCEDCHAAEHKPVKVLNFYLAGKVTKNGWRESIVSDFRNMGPIGNCGHESIDPFPEIAPACIDGTHGYTGPFFVGCDHGCFHGPTLHGSLSAAFLYDVDDEAVPKPPPLDEPSRRAIVGRDFSGIARADVVFAWIDSLDCYGTLVEIGFAAARGTRVFVGIKDGVNVDELWFAAHCADAIIYADSPRQAFDTTLAMATK